MPWDAACSRHLILGIGRRMRVSSSFWPGFVPRWRGDTTIAEAALVRCTGVLYLHPPRGDLSTLGHTIPWMWRAHDRRPHPGVVMLQWPLLPWKSVSHGGYGVALWMAVGRIHAGLRRRPRLKSHRTWTKGRAVSRAHVGMMVSWLHRVRIGAHWISCTHVMPLSHSLLHVKAMR